jgi:hypothetical protein
MLLQKTSQRLPQRKEQCGWSLSRVVAETGLLWAVEKEREKQLELTKKDRREATCFLKKEICIS